jgi:hypothetical protein
VAASAQELPDHSGDGIEQITAAWCCVMIPHICVGAGPAACMMMIMAFCYVTYTESKKGVMNPVPAVRPCWLKPD